MGICVVSSKKSIFPLPASQEEKQVTLGKSETIDHFREFDTHIKISIHGRMFLILSHMHVD